MGTVLTQIQGLITFVVGLLSFGLMPASPTQTANWFRGKKGWFTERWVSPLNIMHSIHLTSTTEKKRS